MLHDTLLPSFIRTASNHQGCIEIAPPCSCNPSPRRKPTLCRVKRTPDSSEHPRHVNNLLPLRHRHNIRQMRHLGRFGQFGSEPGFIQYMSVVKLQLVQIGLERAPRQTIQNLRKTIGQLIFDQIINLLVKIRSSPAHTVAV